MFRRWVFDVTYEVARRGDAGGPDLKKQLCGFAEAVKTVALDGTLPAEEAQAMALEQADHTLKQHRSSWRSLISLELIPRPNTGACGANSSTARTASRRCGLSRGA